MKWNDATNFCSMGKFACLTRSQVEFAPSMFGIALPQKVTCLRREIGKHLEDLPGYANLCVNDLLAHTAKLDVTIAEYDRAIAQAARDDERSKRLMKLPGIGQVTASAMLASISGGHDFDNGRQVAAWIGLVPGQ